MYIHKKNQLVKKQKKRKTTCLEQEGQIKREKKDVL